MGYKLEDISQIDPASGYDYDCMCPWCQEEGRKFSDYKLSVSTTPGKRIFHCYRCNRSGTLNTLLRMFLPASEVFEMLKEDLTKEPEEYKQIVEPDLFNLDAISRPITKFHTEAIKYLSDRGISESVIGKYGLRLGEKFYSDRIVLPIFNDFGDCVYFTARDYLCREGQQKYLNPFGGNKGNVVWNLNNAREQDRLILTEGIFDGIAVGNISEATPIAGLGKSLSDTQIDLIANKKPCEVILCYDPDVSTKELNTQVKRLEAAGLYVSVMRITEGDPNECSLEHLSNAFKNRKTSFSLR